MSNMYVGHRHTYTLGWRVTAGAQKDNGYGLDDASPAKGMRFDAVLHHRYAGDDSEQGLLRVNVMSARPRTKDEIKGLSWEDARTFLSHSNGYVLGELELTEEQLRQAQEYVEQYARTRGITLAPLESEE